MDRMDPMDAMDPMDPPACLFQSIIGPNTPSR